MKLSNAKKYITDYDSPKPNDEIIMLFSIIIGLILGRLIYLLIILDTCLSERFNRYFWYFILLIRETIQRRI